MFLFSSVFALCRTLKYIVCFCLSITDLVASIASVSVGFRGKELLSPQFLAGKIPFLGLSLLPNPTETLATQANNLVG